jgi:DNA-directed RNA polymerase specialized sigma24 family protein
MQQIAVLDRRLDHSIQSNQQPRNADDHAAASAATSELVVRACLGEQPAWDQLVERYGEIVWAVARAHGLGPADAADVSRVTWLLLTQHLGSLPQPERLGVWLHATATREAFRMCRLRGSEASAGCPSGIPTRQPASKANTTSVPPGHGSSTPTGTDYCFR